VRPTRRSDLYSLGAVMYVMLTGRPPFTGQNTNEILQKQQFAQCDKPSRYAPGTPRLLEDFVCQLLEKDAARRPPDALVVMKRLEQIQARIDYTQAQAGIEPGQTAAATRQSMPGPDTDVDEVWRGPGPATIVRNFIRDEAMSGQPRTAIGRFFDNTCVLVMMLELIIASGVFFARQNQVAPADQLAEATAIMESAPSTSWLRARDSLLQPLLDDDLLPEEDARIRAMIRQIDQYEFCRSLKTQQSSDGTVRSELERLMRRAFNTYTDGDPVSARTQLQDLIAMLSDDPEFSYFHQFLVDTESEWTSVESITSRRQVLQRVIDMESAPLDISESDRISARRNRLNATLRLYGDDAALLDLLEQIQQLLSQLPATAEAEAEASGE
jgi:serine/threonine protein kinase